MNLIKYPNLFFTSDLHLYHKFMVRGMRDENDDLLPGAKIPRPMFSSVEEMNEVIIEKNNERVRKGDLVYDLGDLALKTTEENVLSCLNRMNGQRYQFEGNHDDIAKKLAKKGAFVWFKQLKELSLSKPYFDNTQKITLCHYALRVWPDSFKGSFQLYGHSHGMLPEDWECPECHFVDPPHALQFDVGVDCHNFYPVSIEEVKAKMELKKPAWEAYRERLKGSGRAE